MKEITGFYKINNKNTFIFKFISGLSKRTILFLNPLFDEKEKAESFQLNLAKKLCRSGLNCILFDYYGTGNSDGYGNEFDIEDSVNIIEEIFYNYLHNVVPGDKYLLGTRFGADLALYFALKNEPVKNIIAVDPIIRWPAYATEIGLRQRAFKHFNLIKQEDNILINNVNYFDYQGLPISDKNFNFLNSDNILSGSFSDKKIILYCQTNSVFEKDHQSFIKANSGSNYITYKTDNHHSFWWEKQNNKNNFANNNLIPLIKNVFFQKKSLYRISGFFNRQGLQ